jgi:hypothetical protein
MLTRRHVLAWNLTVAAVVLAGCAALDSPRQFTLEESELQRLVERRFPLDRRMLELLDVTMAAPRLRLLPDSNRVATELEISSRDRVLGMRLSGKLAFDAMLRYEPGDQSLRLKEVRVNELSLAGGAGSSRSTVERLGAVVAERVLEDFSVYTLPPDRAARLLQAGVQPASVAVTRRGVEVTLQPVQR